MSATTALESIIGPRKSREVPVEAKPAAKAEPRASEGGTSSAGAVEPRKAEAHGPAKAEQVRAHEPKQSATAPTDSGDDGDAEIEPGESGLKKALVSERKMRREERKRVQDLQRQLDHLTGQMSAMGTSRKQDEPKQLEDMGTKELDEFLVRGPEWTRRVVADEVRSVRHQAVVERIEDAEAEFAEKHSDAREMFAKFGELAQRVPGLIEQFRAVVERKDQNYRNPAKFAYDYAKAYSQAAEVGDLGSYREKLRAELRAELEAERGGVVATEEPKTLAGARGSGGASAQQRYAGPTPLEAIVGPRKKAQR